MTQATSCGNIIPKINIDRRDIGGSFANAGQQRRRQIATGVNGVVLMG
jgi:hypothetical protein